MTPDRIPALERATQHLVEATRNLADAARAQNVRVEEARKEARHTRFGVYGVLLLLVGQIVIDVLFLGAFVHRNDTVGAIRDCTTPAGRCYQRSQQATGAAIQAIQRTDVAIALCSRNPANATETAMFACVQRLSK